MARIRTIKPEFFTSDDVCMLPMAARLLYIGVWCEADRDGRLEWRPRNLKRRYLPDDDVDIDALCQRLTDAGLVVLYGDGLAYVPTFNKHQHVNPREAQSTLPEPKEAEIDACTTRDTRDSDGVSSVNDAQVGREGKEGKGREGASGNSSRKRNPSKTALPNDFGVSDRVRSWAAEKGHSRLEQHLESFRSKAAANAYTYADWDAAFMEAIRGNWAKLPTDAGGAAPMHERPGGGRKEL